MAKRLLTTFFCKSKNALPADYYACSDRYSIHYGVSHAEVREAVSTVYYCSKRLYKGLPSAPDDPPYLVSERRGRLIYHIAQHACLTLKLDGYLERRR